MRRPLLDPQPWEWRGPRVLIEHADAARADALAASLRQAGYAVAICPGPAPGERCPLAKGDGCAAVVGADLVVSGLGLETPAAREALGALRTQAPRLPIVVEADADEVARWPQLVGCALVAPTAAPEQVVTRVKAELEWEVSDVA